MVGSEATIDWPDEVRVRGRRAAAAGIHVHLGPQETEWAVLTLLLVEAPPPRPPLVARIVEAVEERYRSPNVPVLADYLRRCETIGRRVTARLVPIGPGGVQITGRAANVLTDGALVIETDTGSRIAVRPQNLGLLERR